MPAITRRRGSSSRMARRPEGGRLGLKDSDRDAVAGRGYRRSRAAHKVMGAGIAASPHFPSVDAKAGEGQALFLWRIGIRPKPCGSDRFPLGSPPRDIAAAARSPFQVLLETLLLRQLSPGLPRILLFPGRLPGSHRNIATPPMTLSLRLRPKAPALQDLLRKVGSAPACAFASRFSLASPFHRFGNDHPCGCPPLSAVASVFRFASFPKLGFRPRTIFMTPLSESRQAESCDLRPWNM